MNWYATCSIPAMLEVKEEEMEKYCTSKDAKSIKEDIKMDGDNEGYPINDEEERPFEPKKVDENEHKIYQQKEIPDSYGPKENANELKKKPYYYNTWQRRLANEYKELKDKYERLHRIIVRYEAGTLDFKPKCSLELLKKQASAMGQYLYILEVSAEIEKIII